MIVGFCCIETIPPFQIKPFENNLAKDLNKFYNLKLSKTFKVSNKLKNKGYDPVTTSDKAFEMKIYGIHRQGFCKLSPFIKEDLYWLVDNHGPKTVVSDYTTAVYNRNEY